MLKKLDEILNNAKKLNPKKTAVVGSADELTLLGVKEAYNAGLIIPSLIGNGNNIKKIAEKIELPIEKGNIEIINSETDEHSAKIACEFAKNKKIDIIMKGHIHTDILMHAVMSAENGLKTNRLISHLFLMEIKTYKKLLIITDAAINISPNLIEKAQILQNAIDFAIILGIKLPKAAVLSATEEINPKMQSTLDAALLSKMAERGQIKNGIVDGPLAFDNVISKEAALEKGIKSSVSGDTDIVLVPNIESGNILFKDLEYLAGATVAGIVVGAALPVILTSRSDTQKARLYSAAMAIIASNNYKSFLNYHLF